MIPGVSRSAATIIGGMQQKLTRKAAAEFSFFLAVPTMFAATAKKLLDFYKDGRTITSEEWSIFAIVNLVGFLVAIIAIARKIIVLDYKYYTEWKILSIAGLLVALSVSYYLIKRAGIRIYKDHSENTNSNNHEK